jgi:hypothetical protein
MIAGTSKGLRHRPRVGNPVEILGLGPRMAVANEQGNIQPVAKAGRREDDQRKQGG